MTWNQNQQYLYGSNANSTQQYQQQQATNTPAGHQHQQQQQPPFQSQSQYPMNSNSMPPAYPFSQQHGVQQQQPPPSAYPMYSSAGQNQFVQSTAAYTNASTAQMYPQHAQQQQPGPPNYSSYPSASASASESTATSVPAYSYNYNYGQPQPQTQTFPPPPPPPPPPKQQTTPKIKTQTENTAQAEIVLEHQHHCKTCSVSFPNQKALQAHLNSHIKCSKCSFTASKKVVSAHYKAKHGEYAGRGLKTISIQIPGNRSIQKFKICIGNHPDDIQAWIEERKKRFPTRENLKKKMDKCKRNREEGAVGFGAARNGNGNDDEGKKQRMNGDAVVAIAIVEEKSDLPVSSISNLIAGYGSSSDEDEVVKKDATVVDIQTCTDVSMQTKSTGNDPSSTTCTSPSASNHKTKFCRYFLRNGTCKNGDECTYIHDMAKREAFKTNAALRKQKQSQRDRARNDAQKEMNVITTGRTKGMAGHGAAPQTLLRKLLQNDIRRERSLALQLLRYIVDCNYLQEKREDQLKSETQQA